MREGRIAPWTDVPRETDSSGARSLSPTARRANAEALGNFARTGVTKRSLVMRSQLSLCDHEDPASRILTCWANDALALAVDADHHSCARRAQRGLASRRSI